MKKLNFTDIKGETLKPHFHITEVGLTGKNFIDCGGKWHEEMKVSFQMWYANNDSESPEQGHTHITPQKLLDIIELSKLNSSSDNLEVQVEYQGLNTIELYGLGYDTKLKAFVLMKQETDCLAKEQCGIKPDSSSSYGCSEETGCGGSTGCC